jgi:hypothetical protein
MESFRKAFKAVPLEPKPSKGLEERDKPGTTVPIDWGLAALGVLVGVCVGLAYVLSAA